MEQNNIGLIIKQLRLKKKISQKELSYGICSLSQIYRIEKGKHFPSAFLLQQISEKLGEDMSKYTMFSNCTNAIYFFMFFKRLEELRLRRKYSNILELISVIEGDSKYKDDMKLPNIKQLIGWYEGIAITNTTSKLVAIEYYVELLKYTASFRDINELFKSALSNNEIKLIHSISSTYCKLNKFSLAKDILLSLINNINTYNSDIFLLPEIYYNLSKLLFLEKNFTESVLYANKGIEFCREYNFMRILPDLFYIIGQCYEALEDNYKSIESYGKFTCLYDIFGHDKFSLKCKRELIEKFGSKIITLSS